MTVPVMTIDGPSASGKGTLARSLAKILGWHYLDSGALYRVLALQALDLSIPLNDEAQLSELARHLPVRFDEATGAIFLKDLNVTSRVRLEETGRVASSISAYPLVRKALLDLQHSFRKAPGLVTDGRDMGTVVFPDAELKIFLTATPQARAQRRLAELQGMGLDVKLPALIREIELRDQRDRERVVSPLLPASDAIVLDSSHLSAQAVLDNVLTRIKR